MDSKDLDSFLAKYPHNLSIEKPYLDILIGLCLDKQFFASPEECVNFALYNYGGTIAEALIDMLNNV